MLVTSSPGRYLTPSAESFLRLIRCSTSGRGTIAALTTTGAVVRQPPGACRKSSRVSTGTASGREVTLTSLLLSMLWKRAAALNSLPLDNSRGNSVGSTDDVIFFQNNTKSQGIGTVATWKKGGRLF